MKECEADGGLKLLVANAGGEFFGYQAVCPHQDVPLCEGLYDGTTLTCHMHLWQWDIRSGARWGCGDGARALQPVGGRRFDFRRVEERDRRRRAVRRRLGGDAGQARGPGAPRGVRPAR
jgi:nitrite reductase/ring-hydroxylating ferredoxin subunit